MELEAGEQTRGAEESDKPNDTRADEGTVNNTTHSYADTSEDTNCPEMSKSAERLQSSTDEPMEINTGQTVDVSNGYDTEIPNEPLKSKSKTKSKKGASKATPRKKEFSSSDATVTKQATTRRTKSNRKSKRNTGKKSAALSTSDEDNSEKENFANDSDDVLFE